MHAVNSKYLTLHVGRSDQQKRLCVYSNEDQRVQHGGPDISLLRALQRQWDHAANAHLGNIVIKPFSSRSVAWKCDACPDGHLHQWTAVVYGRTRGSGCPHCKGRKVCKHNCLRTVAPWAAAQWHYNANAALGTPELWWHTATSQLAGIARIAATCGLSPLTSVCLSSLAAQSVPPEVRSSGIQPLQSVSTRSWQSGTTSAMKPAATIWITQG